MLIPILQSLVTLLFGFIGIEMANKPPTTKGEQWRYRLAFILAGVVFLALSWIGFAQAANKEAKAAKKVAGDAKTIQTISNNQTNLEQTFHAKFDNLQSNLLAFQMQQREIEMTLATNSTYDSKVRERVIASHEKLEDLNLKADDLKLWMESIKGRFQDKQALAEIQHENDLKQKRLEYEQGFPYFDYAFNSLTNMLGQVAKLKNDKLETDCQGVPLTINPEKSPMRMGNIKLLKTPGWEFFMGWDGDGSLRIYDLGRHSQLAINYSGSMELTISGLPNDDFSVSTNDFRNPIDQRLKMLIAYRDLMSSKTN
jgi:hypothetical protein